MQTYNDKFVIGEWTQIIKPTDNTPAEEFNMKVSYSADKPKENKFFGDSHFWRPTAKYLSYGKNDPNIIIVRDGYFTGHRLQQQWIAINPACAYTLGWEPLEEDLLHGRMRTASEWLNLFTGSVVIRIFVVVQITKLVKDGSYLLHQSIRCVKIIITIIFLPIVEERLHG